MMISWSQNDRGADASNHVMKMNYEEARMGIGESSVSSNRNSRGGDCGAISFAAIRTATVESGTVANCRLRPSTGRFAHFSEWEKSIKMSLIARDRRSGPAKKSTRPNGRIESQNTI
jgi:hypothetical protein